MDALSHALITCILFSAHGLSPLIPFAVLGAVIPDADIIFPAISDRTPSLYLFTHGGIAHSIFGVCVLSLLSYSAAVLLASAGIIPIGIFTAAGIYGIAAVLAGALLHVAIDVMACPGIPILAPLSDRKYTLGILPGPSILLAGVAFGFVVVTLLSLLPFSSAIMLYGVTVIIYIAARLGLFLVAGARLPGRKIPCINPLRWLVIQENENSYRIRTYKLFCGNSDEMVLEKYRNTGARELARAQKFPEVRRFLFCSYIVTAERTGSVLTLADPLREKGYVQYPFKFRRVIVNLD